MSDDTEREFVCKACGAKMLYAPGMQSLKCEFCGTVSQLTADYELVPEGQKASWIVPMKVDQRLIEIAAYERMAEGTYTPDDMIETSRFVRFEKFYAPFFQFNGEYDGTWTASFGYDRRESYTEWVSDTQGRRPETRHRTVTDWSPVSGDVRGGFSLAGYAGSKLPNVVACSIEKTDKLTDVTSDVGSYSAGIEIEGYETPERDTFSERVKARVDIIVESDVKGNAQGNHQRDWRWSTRYSYEASTVLLPVCHTVFEYNGQEYSVWVDGADIKRLVADSLPEDKERRSDVASGFVPFGIASAIAGLSALILSQDSTTQPGIYWGLGAATSVALGYGLARRSALLDYSRGLRRAVLGFQKASIVDTHLLSDMERNALTESFQRPSRNWLATKGNKVVIVPSLAAAASVLLAANFGNVEKLTSNRDYTAISTESSVASERSSVPGGAADDQTSQAVETQQASPDLEAKPATEQPTDLEPSPASPAQSSSPDVSQRASEDQPSQPAIEQAPAVPQSGPDQRLTNEDSPSPSAQGSTSATASTLEEKTLHFLQRYWEVSNDPQTDGTNLVTFYKPQVSYYGIVKDRSEILKEKNAFFKRWPQRQYSMGNDVSVSCRVRECGVSGTVTWTMSSEARRATSLGTANFELSVDWSDDNPLIDAESSKVVSRQLGTFGNPVPLSATDEVSPSGTNNAAQTQCDELAANPNDHNKTAGISGTAYEDLPRQASQAIAICRQAMIQNPNELKYKYQYARALSVSNPAGAAALFRELIGQAYPAAYDNLGSLILRQSGNISEAANLFLAGAKAGDPDSMLSLASLIDAGYVNVPNPEKTKLSLLTRAADLGDQAAQAEIARESQESRRAQERVISERQEQQMMLNLFQGMIRGIPR